VIRVLAIADDEQVRRVLEHVVADEGDTLVPVRTIEACVETVSSEPIDIAFVELRVEAGAALALCHHLPSVRPGMRLYAILHPSEIDRGPEALALGATGILVAPPTGDAVARLLGDYKAEQVRRREVTTLEAKLARERKRTRRS